MELTRAREHVSYSEWQLFRRCSVRWYNETILGKKIDTSNESSVFGRSIHNAMQTLFNVDPSKRADPLTDFNQTFLQESVNLSLDERKSQTLRDAAVRIIEDSEKDEWLNEGVPLFNELPLMEDIDRDDGIKMKFKGFVDVAFKRKAKRGNKDVVYVCDYKTCTWGWNAEKRMDFDVLSQLYLYKHFICKKFSLDPSLVRTAYILLKKTPRPNSSAVELLNISSGPKALSRTLETFQQDIGLMKSIIVSDGKLATNNWDACSDYGGCPHNCRR